MACRSIVVWVALLAQGACGGSAVTGPRSIAGQYVLVGVDGMAPPCCAKPDASGTYATTDSVDAAELDLAGNGTYVWGITPNYTYADGTTTTRTPFTFSSGTYTWDGAALTLVDSGSLRTITGSVTANVIALETSEHRYRFLRLIDLPPGS